LLSKESHDRLNPGIAREGREVQLDSSEGADIVMVDGQPQDRISKSLRSVRDATRVPWWREPIRYRVNIADQSGGWLGLAGFGCVVANEVAPREQARGGGHDYELFCEDGLGHERVGRVIP